jgi:hypothetical protein
MHELPALLALAAAIATAPGNAMTGTDDPPKLLHIDVDQLAGTLALVAVGWLRRLESRELAKPDPGQDPRHRRRRHSERERDVLPGQAQLAQRGDRADAILAGAIRNRERRRGAIEEPRLSISAITPNPLPTRALAHARGLGRVRERPLQLDNPTHHRQTTLRAESSVSVQLHPVSSLGLRGFDTTQPPGRPG